jgi:GntR family transcriptional regulator, transcriptional repressor for pyruvate dehydrogenase complex
MALRPVTRRTVSDQVFDQVLADVVTGELAVGERLPSERRLAEVLGVSRPAVREALQRMAQTRLVEVRHGGSTTVRDYRHEAGPDLLPQLLVRDGSLDTAVARSILEARAAVGPGIAALAAERGGPALGATLTALTDTLGDIEEPVAWQRRTLAYWEALVDGADSIAFRLMFNSLRDAYEPVLPALAGVLADEVGRVDPYRVLATAVGSGDPATARAAAERVLAPATDAILAALAAATDEEDG